MASLGDFVDHIGKIKFPKETDDIYKDECIFSFDTPESRDGLYICMFSFLGLSKKYLEKYYEKTGNAIFLHHKRICFENKVEDTLTETTQVTRLAIGVEGGFDSDAAQYIFKDVYEVVVLPHWKAASLDADCVPKQIKSCADALIALSAASVKEATTGVWDGEFRCVSRYAEALQQISDPPVVPPTGWCCADCDLDSNLWLNLTDGSIHCGRRHFDGSGGRGHALDHFQKTGFPLTVKLGTIVGGAADVFSYPEDDMVQDPHLAKHLEHFGINMNLLKKTEKTVAELEIHMNQKAGEWIALQEADRDLEVVHGPGLTGIHNLDNSCYMNATLQIIASLPHFKQRFADAFEAILANSTGNPAKDFNLQMSKLVHSLLSGEYSFMKRLDPATGVVQLAGIRPRIFRALMGAGHPEFHSKRQQDAHEFLLYLLSLISRASTGVVDPTRALLLHLEDRTQCCVSGKVRYTKREELVLSLPVKVPESEDEHSRTSLQTCLENFAGDCLVSNVYSEATGQRNDAKRRTRIKTFPDVLILQLRRFYCRPDWTPAKLNVAVDVPHDLDLEHLRAQGIQPGEEEMPPPSEAAPPTSQIDEAAAEALAEMGFPLNGCRRALLMTQGQGQEAAMNWILEHMDDPDFASPLTAPKADVPCGEVSMEVISSVMSLGFTEAQARLALSRTDGNPERAVDWIFSHMDEVQAQQNFPTDSGMSASSVASKTFTDGSAKYRLKAFLSHMGSSSSSGHYVCHVRTPIVSADDGKAENQWVLFNDEKVLLSKNLPLDLGYLYFYERV